MSASNWTLQQVNFSEFPGDRALGLDLAIQTGKDLFKDRVSPISTAMRGSLPHGSLFAYLFRRFGYPESGWDNHKELVGYVLSTPRKDMIMRVTPYPGAKPDLSISFLSTPEVIQACRTYTYRKVRAHEAAFYTWIERQGLVPDWFDEWIAVLQTNPGPIPVPETLDHSKAAHLLIWLDIAHAAGKDHPWYQWYQAQLTAYRADCPAPDPEYRDPDWTTWPDEDPLKACMRAALETLTELSRPVWVRDWAIDPWGAVNDLDIGEEENDASYHQVSGYPSGALGNADPEGFAELHTLISTLSPGNPQDAIAKAFLILEAAAKKDAPT